MLQYILNTTAIWLISLVLFDVFLRRESFHSYNRFYLLFTFLLAIFLPIWQWQDDSSITATVFRHPVEQVVTAKQHIIAAGTPDAGFDWPQWLVIIYLTGAAVAIFLFIAEIVKLANFYRNGKRSTQDDWVIIETGKEHAPFSFTNTLFVGSRQQYTDKEWNMVLIHEKRHSALIHLADLLLMQVCRIIFWFHPLVYVYNKRLLLVHEYQADSVSAKEPQLYGRFLIEQAVLQAAPALSHSFNRTPIKKRIVMLTHRSSEASKVKMLVFIPLALVSIVCFSKNSFSQKFVKNGDFVTYKGNKFELSKTEIDTQIITDPVTGKEMERYISHDPTPLKMNGEKIYRDDEITTKPELKTNDYSFRKYILSHLAAELNKLDDGSYGLSIYSVVVGKDGQLVFYDFQGIEKMEFGYNSKTPIPTSLKKEIENKTNRLLANFPKFTPGKLHDKNAIVLINERWNSVEVKDHKVVIN